MSEGVIPIWSNYSPPLEFGSTMYLGTYVDRDTVYL